MLHLLLMYEKTLSSMAVKRGGGKESFKLLYQRNGNLSQYYTAAYIPFRSLCTPSSIKAFRDLELSYRDTTCT